MKDYDNLVIVDFICLGVNSPKVFRKYLDYLEDRYQSKIVYFKAKNKELGWRQLTSKVVFQNKQILYDTKDTSFFTIGYLGKRYTLVLRAMIVSLKVFHGWLILLWQIIGEPSIL